MLLFLLLGLTIHFWRRRLLRGCLLLADVLCLLLLCLTYSRGGYLACLLTLALCQLLSSRPFSPAPPTAGDFPRYGHALVLGGMLFLLFLVPAGRSRLAKTADTQDRSILNRLWLWRGGAILMSESPWKGYPLQGENPGLLYSAFYQPLDRHYAYTSFLNGTLDTARKGMPWLWCVSLLSFTLLLLALLAWENFQDPLCLHAGATWFSFLVANQFTNFSPLLPVQLLLLTTALLLLCRFLWLSHQPHPPLRKGTWLLLPLAPFLATTFCLALYATGRFCRLCHPHHWLETTLELHHTGNGTLLPRKPPKGHILFFSAHTPDHLRTELLPLAHQGYAIQHLQLSGDMESLPLIQETINQFIHTEEATLPHFLVASGGNVANAVLAALRECPNMRRLEAIILVHPIENHPFPLLAFRPLPPEAPPCHVILPPQETLTPYPGILLHPWETPWPTLLPDSPRTTQK
ncbi:MAG: O-antigen ligase family protein [Oligosphaeraceae bacterium]